MASDATDRVADTHATRPCEICGRPIEAIRIEVIPATRLCQLHGQMIQKFGGEFIVKSREDRTSKKNSLKKNYGGVNLWRPYTNLKAVRNDNLFTLNGELLNRAGPRMVAGTAALCEKLELARQHRK